MAEKLVVAAVIVALFSWTIAMQVVRKQVTVKRLVMIPLGFAVLALANGVGWASGLRHPLALTFFSLGVLLAVGMGFVRAATITVTRTERGPVSKGGWLTVVTWLATVGVRVAVAVVSAKAGAAEGAGEIMLFIAATIAVQNLVIAKRAGLLGGTPAIAAVSVTS